MSWTPWQSAQVTTSCCFDSSRLRDSEAVTPWKSARYVCATVGRDAVLRHEGVVAVAADAGLGRTEPELRGAGLLHLMVGVAVGARRHVLVVVLHQHAAVHAAGVHFIHVRVAGGAAARHHRALRVRVRDVVRAVAVGADGRDVDAGLQQVVVHALERAGVGVEMALLADFVGLDGVGPPALERRARRDARRRTSYGSPCRSAATRARNWPDAQAATYRLIDEPSFKVIVRFLSSWQARQ